MNKLLKSFLYLLGFMLILWTVGRLTNMFQYFNAPSSSNEPGIKKGEKFFASNLVKPKLLNFICFNTEDPDYGKVIWVFRLCGLSGDVIELRKGDLFVNDEPVDKKIRVKNMYDLRIEQYEKIKDSVILEEWMEPDYIHDVITLPLEEEFIKRHKIKAVRNIVASNYKDPYISKTFSQPWNTDNFGPIKVPADKYFVLGDNRHNAQDSRYIGFIDKKDYVGTVLWK